MQLILLSPFPWIFPGSSEDHPNEDEIPLIPNPNGEAPVVEIVADNPGMLDPQSIMPSPWFVLDLIEAIVKYFIS